MKREIQANIWKLYVGTVLHELLLIAAIIVPFLGSIGLSMQQILITESVFAAIIVGLEIPSGYFADRVGRKISIILGALFWLIGSIIYAFSNTFFDVVLASALWGVGSSFTSGAFDALLYESLLYLKKKKEYKKVQGNIYFYGRLASVVGSVSAGIMAIVSLRLPVIVGVFPFLLWFLLSLTLKETKHEDDQLETWSHFKKIFAESFLHNKTLRSFILFTGIAGFFTLDFWLRQRYLEFLAIPILYFGMFHAVMSIASGLASRYAKEIEDRIGERQSLMMIAFVPPVAWLAIVYGQSVWILLVFFVTAALRGFYVPVFNTYIQHHVSSDRRATILSVMSFLRRIVFLVIAPYIGWIADLYTIQTAFLYTLLIMIAFALVSLGLLRRVKII